MENNYTKAIDYSKKILNQDQDYIGAVLVLAALLLDEQKYEEAKGIINKGIEIDPQNEVLYFLSGNYYYIKPEPEYKNAFKNYSKKILNYST